MPGEVGALSCPKLKEFWLLSFFGEDGEVSHKKALQGVRKNLDARTIEFIKQLILYSAGKPSGKAPR